MGGRAVGLGRQARVHREAERLGLDPGAVQIGHQSLGSITQHVAQRQIGRAVGARHLAPAGQPELGTVRPREQQGRVVVMLGDDAQVVQGAS